MLRFPDDDLELHDGVLRRAGQEVTLPPLLSRLLVYLAENRGRLVPKQELLGVVWPDAHVTESSLYQALHGLRRVLGPDAIRNARGRGYELALRIEEMATPPDPHRLPLVGRSEVMSRVGETLTRVREGSGRLLLLSGPAGIGKTRLLDETVETARRRGFTACRGGAPQDHFEQALWPWEQVLSELLQGDRSLLDELWPAQVLALQRVFPVLARDPLPPERLDPVAARLRLFESVALLLARGSRRRPLLLVFDDVHRADAMSLRLLEWVADRIADLPIAIAAARRDTAQDTDPQVAEAITRMLGDPGVASESLGALSREDVAEAVSAVHGGEADPRMVEAAYARSGGNPLFLRALLLAGDAITSPPSSEVRAAVSLHLSVLTDRTRALLRAGSVLGLEIDRDLGRALCEEDEETWRRALDEAVRHGLLERREEGVAFVHALVWEVLHAELGAEERRSLHARAFRLLEDHADADPRALEARADHATRAIPALDLESAIRCCVAAAEAAEQRLAIESAVRLYRKALDLAPASAPRWRLSLMVALAEACSKLGDGDAVAEQIEPLVALSQQLDDDLALARGVLALAPFRDDANDPDSAFVALLETALAAHRSPSERRAQLLSRLAHVRWYLEPPERARRIALDALALAGRSAGPAALVDVLVRVHRVLQSGPGDESVRGEIVRRLEQAVDAVPNSLVRVEALQTLAWEALVAGDRNGFDQWIERVQREAREVHAPHVRWWRLTARASREYLCGRLEAAERLASEAFELARGTGQPLGVPSFALQMVSLRRSQERMGELEGLLAGVAAATPARLPWQIAWHLAELGAGRPGPARELLRVLVADRFEPLGRDVSYAPTLVMLAETALALGDGAAAHGLRDRFLAIRDRHVVVGPGFFHWGSAAHWIGRLSEGLGDDAEAERWYGEALERDRRLGALEFVARGQLALGRVLSARGGDDAARGATLRREGAALASDLRMPWLR